MKLVWTPQADKEIRALPDDVNNRITKKLEWYATQPLPLRFAKRLSGPLAKYSRFRIGEYRVIVNPNGQILHIVRAIKHSETYS